jgi:hypothetical protein
MEKYISLRDVALRNAELKVAKGMRERFLPELFPHEQPKDLTPQQAADWRRLVGGYTC